MGFGSGLFLGHYAMHSQIQFPGIKNYYRHPLEDMATGGHGIHGLAIPCQDEKLVDDPSAPGPKAET
jgi:hypothetical protein